MVEAQHLIDGSWTVGTAATARRFEVTDPADGSLIGQVPVATPGEVTTAVAAAAKAAEQWARTAPAERRQGGPRGGPRARRLHRRHGGCAQPPAARTALPPPC